MGCCGSDSTDEIKNFRPQKQPNNPQTVQVDNQNVVKKVVKSRSNYEIFVESALNMHNHYRAQHGAEPLTVSQDLNKIAQDYANHIAKKIQWFILRINIRENI